MKSPLIIASVVAAVCSIIIFFVVSQNTNIDATYIAVMAFISAVITNYIANTLSSTDSSSSLPREQSPPSNTNDAIKSAPSTGGSVETLYVGNLPYKANETAVKEYLNNYVDVQSVRLMKDRKTGKRKGYGFVEVLTNDLESAISGLNDKVFLDRSIKVRPAKDKTEAEA